MFSSIGAVPEGAQPAGRPRVLPAAEPPARVTLRSVAAGLRGRWRALTGGAWRSPGAGQRRPTAFPTSPRSPRRRFGRPAAAPAPPARGRLGQGPRRRPRRGGPRSEASPSAAWPPAPSRVSPRGFAGGDAARALAPRAAFSAGCPAALCASVIASAIAVTTRRCWCWCLWRVHRSETR